MPKQPTTSHRPTIPRAGRPQGELRFSHAAGPASFAAEPGPLDAYATSGSSPPAGQTPPVFPTAPDSVWMTLAEVADELRVSVRTVMRWVQRGELPAIELPGGMKRVHRETFQLWLASLSTTSVPLLENA